MDELKEIIFDNNYTNKLKGGVIPQDIININNGYINERTHNPNQHISLDNNNNRGIVCIKFYRTPPPNPNPLNLPGLTHTIRILHAGNCFLCDQYNIINIIESIRNNLYNNNGIIPNNIINLMNNDLMDNGLMDNIHCGNINNNVIPDPIIVDPIDPINIIDNTINLNTDLGNIINFRYVLEEMSQQFNNFIQQIDELQHNPQHNQNIPLDNNNRINYRNFLQQTIEEIDYLLNPHDHFDPQINYIQRIAQRNQQIAQLNIFTHYLQIQTLQNEIHNLQNDIINTNLVLQQYENYIHNHINPQIIQRKELIIQLNQLLNQCHLGFIKRTVRNFNQRIIALGINPIISSHINVNNIYDLEIDLQHNYIVDHCNKIYSNDIGDINTNQNYITELLEKVIKRLIDLDYNEYTNGIWLDAYSGNNNIQPVPIIDIENTRITLYKSITSLLIMILTIRHNMNKNIYKTYNNSYLLAAVCKYMFLKNMPPNDYADVFGGGNVNLLTYIEHTIGGVIGFYGDCVLNVLTCVRNRDLRELFVHKIKYSENQFINPLHNPQNQNLLQLQYNIQIAGLYTNPDNIANFNLIQDHYINLINNELNNNILPVYAECEFKTFIRNFVYGYRDFVGYIITNSRKIHERANEIRNGNINFGQNMQFVDNEFRNIYRWYKRYYSVLRNNL